VTQKATEFAATYWSLPRVNYVGKDILGDRTAVHRIKSFEWNTQSRKLLLLEAQPVGRSPQIDSKHIYVHCAALERGDSPVTVGDFRIATFMTCEPYRQTKINAIELAAMYASHN
jgi:hypothetical protein